MIYVASRVGVHGSEDNMTIVVIIPNERLGKKCLDRSVRDKFETTD